MYDAHHFEFEALNAIYFSWYELSCFVNCEVDILVYIKESSPFSSGCYKLNDYLNIPC